MGSTNELQEFEKSIGYTFNNFAWLEKAMLHSSYTNEHNIPRLDSNERLEFLGDAVLEAVSSEYLYTHYPKMDEGELSKLRASLVCTLTLAYDARVMNLGKYLKLGRGEEATGGRNRDTLISDAVEAVIGAIFMDGGFEEAKRFILKFVLNDVQNKQLFYDSKSTLQEMVQKGAETRIVYEIVSESGPDHDKDFEAEVSINGKPMGRGHGPNKKIAEQSAAYAAILKLKKSNA